MTVIVVLDVGVRSGYVVPAADLFNVLMLYIQIRFGYVNSIDSYELFALVVI